MKLKGELVLGKKAELEENFTLHEAYKMREAKISKVEFFVEESDLTREYGEGPYTLVLQLTPSGTLDFKLQPHGAADKEVKRKAVQKMEKEELDAKHKKEAEEAKLKDSEENLVKENAKLQQAKFENERKAKQLEENPDTKLKALQSENKVLKAHPAALKHPRKIARRRAS